MITIQTAAASVGIGYEVAKKLCHAHSANTSAGRGFSTATISNRSGISHEDEPSADGLGELRPN